VRGCRIACGGDVRLELDAIVSNALVSNQFGGLPMQELKGKTVLITGSTDGVGRLVAKKLGEAGARVLVHGRNEDRGEQVVRDIRQSGGMAELLISDLASLAEVRELAETVTKRTDRLDVLINNAGVGTGGPGGKRQTSADGHELRFAVNYLSGFLLTRLLLPLIRKSTPARIVNVASGGQQPIDFSDVMLTHGYNGTRAYCQSKLAQIMFTIDLARELEGAGIIVNCLHPATYMDTTMVRQAGVTPWSTVEQGAEAILNLAVSPELEGKSGLYFDGLRESRAKEGAYDSKAREQLRKVSLELTGL
jgi:NAD(P)-dependent dehydrogenase (short-subunit alcohol dehydrogenase family)